MKQRKECIKTICGAGALCSFGGLVLIVASMEAAPITASKLLLAGLCLALLYAFSLPLRYRPQQSVPTSTVSAKSQNSKYAA